MNQLKIILTVALKKGFMKLMPFHLHLKEQAEFDQENTVMIPILAKFKVVGTEIYENIGGSCVR